MTESQEPFDGKAFAKQLPGKPGVYRMLDSKGTVIYVGKAKSLKNRVSSYFRPKDQLDAKTTVMVARICAIETTVTHTENEALLLENNLIKELRPRYNIVLRDDKSYPWIYLSTDQEFPRLSFHRGARKGKGRYFGPYPSAGAVRASLNQLQKLFLVRQCEDSFFSNRTRPCLQYQIKRCTAPCTGYILEENYREDVEHAVLFLEGKSQKIIEVLVKRMERASADLKFELAARYRDQIYNLQRLHEKQYVSHEKGNTDIIACVTNRGMGCVCVVFIRDGQLLGSKTYFPGNTRNASHDEILDAFIPQFYLNNQTERAIPETILLSHKPADMNLLAEVLTEHAGKKVQLKREVRGERARWQEMAQNNAELALAQRLANDMNMLQRFNSLQEILNLEDPVERIECFDISHTQGEATVASCVVFGQEGANKAEYRRFNIEDIEPGDDYAAMRQALNRRYTRVRKEDGKLPDILLIDGGKGQTNIAREVLDSLQINEVMLIGVAKGPGRKPGLETLVLNSEEREMRLPADTPALHLIQQVRDEAHRFAITGHRQRRAKARKTSSLEHIEGVGQKRRQNLLQYFGGLQGVAKAGVEDLAKAPGISRALAQKIYDMFHDGT